MKTLKKTILFHVEFTKTGYSAYSENNIISTGTTIYKLTENLLEAANLYYNDLGYLVTLENLKFKFNLADFFKSYRVLNAHFFAKKIGLNPTLLSQYVNGQKKPSSKQYKKIMEGIQEVGVELSNVMV